VASIFVLFIGLAMAELASAAPTSGGVCIIFSFLFRTNNFIFGPTHWLLHDGEMLYAGSSDVRRSTLLVKVA